jgi:hypothetical protein
MIVPEAVIAVVDSECFVVQKTRTESQGTSLSRRCFIFHALQERGVCF